MSKTPQLLRRFSLCVMAAAVFASGCKVRETPAPPLTGPSELGLSITLSASPDTIDQDGASQSQIRVLASDSNSTRLRDVPVRLEIFFNGELFDFGRLSARQVVTGPTGEAFVTYTAPPAPAEPVDRFTIVTILATPVGTNYASALPRQLEIRLRPRGTLIPENVLPIADFTFAPQAPLEAQPVTFDASVSRDPDGQIVSYLWNFGDSTTGAGARVTHTFSGGGSFAVTLTVIDDRNTSDTETKTVTIATSGSPTASFTVSPQIVEVDESVTFNAVASAAATGRRLVRYDWTLGDGDEDDGVLITHEYDTLGTKTVTLTVTDDLGRKATTSNTVTVNAPQRPTASAFCSPAAVLPGVSVTCDGAGSQPAPGKVITSYEWNMGDGRIRHGVRVSHSYTTPATYTVQLTVTDNAGSTASVTTQVTVGQPPAGIPPTASFVISPTPAPPGTFVNFNAAASTATGVERIVSYEWNFGDSTDLVYCPAGLNQSSESQCSTTNVAGVRHRYSTASTFVVTLTVVDSLGRRGTTTQQVQVVP